jgi:trimethylamine:corrinoid methyltransferase-like protein
MEGLGGGKFDEKSGAPEAMLALQQTLQEVGGEFYYYPIAESQSYGYRWWTSSGVQGDNTKAWSIDTNSYKFLLYDASKSETGNMHVRPVFAF